MDLTRDRRLVAGGGVAVLAAALALAAASFAGGPPAPEATADECSDLAKQFDVSAPAHHGAPRAGEAQRDRDEGWSACQAGRYRDGVSQLRRALHAIGVKPVRLAVVPSS
jgi:hypothetical protein